MSVKEFAKRIDVDFKNINLLKEALTHRSYLNEHKENNLNQNERLEFLGDAVLELVVTDYLFSNYDNPEGELTSWRAALVNGDMLAKVSKKIGVEKYLLMSKGESKYKGRARRYLFANALEAIIGAIYLDKGYESADKFIKKNIIINIDEVLKEKLYLDAKSYFQEKSQEHEKITPSYKVTKEEGPDHDRVFTVGVFIGDELVAEGKGPSKQDAQREAASEALKKKGWI